MKYILLPLSVLYGIIIFIRNILFDIGIIPGKKYKMPVISVGNLTTGGTGKTPHVEYLLHLLSSDYHPAVLLRGYARKTSGFRIVEKDTDISEAGDESCQYKSKFDNAVIAVCENRVTGINRIIRQFKEVNVILLDDAFQHRRVRPGLSILLIEFKYNEKPDYLLPMGNLREWSFGKKRADIIVVTKTPSNFSPLERRRIARELKPASYQNVYFSFIKYGNFFPLYRDTGSTMLKVENTDKINYSVLLLTGIADPSYLADHYREKVVELIPFEFPDHHRYSVNDINKVLKVFNNIVNPNKIILTTQKDAVRLKDPEISALLSDKPVFFVPVEMVFHGDDAPAFNRQIKDYVRTHQSYARVPAKQN